MLPSGHTVTLHPGLTAAAATAQQQSDQNSCSEGGQDLQTPPLQGEMITS